MRERNGATGHRHPASEPQHSLWETVLATGVLIAAIFLALLAAASPGAAAVVVGAVVVTLATVRALLRRFRAGRKRTVCIPRIDVCVSV